MHACVRVCVWRNRKWEEGESVDDNLSTKAQHKCSISVAGMAESAQKCF